MGKLWGWGWDVVGGFWTPAQATGGGASAEHWYKADAGTWQDSVGGTAATADGAVVGAWEDQAASGDDVAQGTAASKPTLKLNIKNGRPVLRFDGSNDYLQGAYTTGGALTQPFTILVVAQLASAVTSNDTDYYLMDGDDVGHRAILIKDGVAESADVWRIFAGNNVTGGTCDSAWNIWTAVFNGASSQFWHNGVSEGSGNAGTGVHDGITVGAVFNGALPWTGDIAEIIVYDSNLSTADKNQVAMYLSGRYAISYTSIS